ncbi:MAG TPA: hypothetical protein VKI44_09185 [Acetobacteraceae bacterium]|nr:hypothetical protein [Acetobacteraceae bacterium]
MRDTGETDPDYRLRKKSRKVGTMRSGKAISKKAWRNGWRRDAATTQTASAEVAAIIGYLEQRGFHESAHAIRRHAMRHGVREAKAALGRVLIAASRKFPPSSRPPHDAR